MIGKYRSHGWKLFVDGECRDIDSNLWEKAVAECHRNGYRAIMYEVISPETGEVLAFAVRADGHVDSGTVTHVIDCMESHRLS